MTLPTPWTITDPNTAAVFDLDEAGRMDSGRFSRGSLIGVYSIAARQLITTVVAHNPGERRTASRDVSKRIKFTGFVWGNPSKDESGLRANLDLLQQAMANGIQQLCIEPDGRYWIAELEQFDDGLQEGDVWHCEYTASWYAESPYSYGATTQQAVMTSAALTHDTDTRYLHNWTAGAAADLGSAPSALAVSVTLVTANGCFLLTLTNTSTTPQTVCQFAVPGGGLFLDGDIVTFDGPNAQATLTRSGVTTQSPLPVVPIMLDGTIAAPSAITLAARAASAPVVTIAAAWAARFR